MNRHAIIFCVCVCVCVAFWGGVPPPCSLMRPGIISGMSWCWWGVGDVPKIGADWTPPPPAAAMRQLSHAAGTGWFAMLAAVPSPLFVRFGISQGGCLNLPLSTSPLQPFWSPLEFVIWPLQVWSKDGWENFQAQKQTLRYNLAEGHAAKSSPSRSKCRVYSMQGALSVMPWELSFSWISSAVCLSPREAHLQHTHVCIHIKMHGQMHTYKKYGTLSANLVEYVLAEVSSRNFLIFFCTHYFKF